MVPMGVLFLVTKAERWQINAAPSGLQMILSCSATRLAFCSVCWPARLSLGTAAAAGNDIGRGDVVVVPLQGEVSPSLALFLRRAEKTAESAGACAIIFDMNTYGGRLDAAEEITSILNHATIPTYTYINSNAGSAGSLIALATKHIYMAPVSAIGAAAPILSTGEDLPRDGEGKNDLLLVGARSAARPCATAIIRTSARPS